MREIADTSGFAVVDDVLSADECDAALLALPATGRAGTRSLLERPACRALAGTLTRRLGAALSGMAALQCTLLQKTSSANWLVAWHQDLRVPAAALPPARRDALVVKERRLLTARADAQTLQTLWAARLHLDDSTADNGALRVVPGSHRAGVLDDAGIAAARSCFGERCVTARRGAVMLMRPLLLHASSKSRSGTPRRVLQFLFAPAAEFT